MNYSFLHVMGEASRTNVRPPMYLQPCPISVIRPEGQKTKLRQTSHKGMPYRPTSMIAISPYANHRLARSTVLICFGDAVNACPVVITTSIAGKEQGLLLNQLKRSTAAGFA